MAQGDAHFSSTSPFVHHQYVYTAYTYDAWGNRASMTGNGTSSTYTYDANNRLTKSITEEGSTTTTADYYYDHNGNQITKAVSVTTPQSGVAAYFMSPQTNSYLSMYEYDSYNRLKSADTDGTVTSYTYDGNNLRQSKTTNGITTQHVWDGSNMVMDGTNKFYRGATGIEFAVLNGNTSFYHKDAHGDVTALTDSVGTITQSYIYDAFGNQMNENENDINPFRYCGEYLDSETGLTYLRNRYYDNAIGRFITEDPIKDGLNWYVYCENNPIVHIDPTGLYDRDAAVSYAIKWHDGTNSPSYERFDTIGSFLGSLGRMRGDCANFVSQSLVAGGLVMNSSWHYYMEKNIWMSGTGNHYATSIDRDMTPAWASASAQYKFFSSDWAGYKNGDVIQIWTIEGMKYNIQYNNIKKGDLMFFAHKDSGEVYHATIISEVSLDEIKYAAHTSERDYEPLSKHLEDDFVVIVRIRDDAVKGYTE